MFTGEDWSKSCRWRASNYVETGMKYFLFLLLLLASVASAQPENKLKIIFVGDMMLDELPGQYLKKGGDPLVNFKSLFQSADITIGNLECVIGLNATSENKPFTFLAHPRVIPFLKKNFTAISVANNHTGDFGDKTFAAMLDLLEKNKVPFFGGGKDIRAAHEPLIIERKGKRIAILGYDLFLPRSFEALSDRPGVAWGEDDFVVADIKRAKEFYKSDFVIVFPHWGWEHEKKASPEQQRLAHLMIDHGADIVVGGHPHVTQNIESYKNKFIFYSLGNFIFNGFEGKEANTGWVLELDLNQNLSLNWQVHEAKLKSNGIPKNNGVIFRSPSAALSPQGQ